MHRLRDSRGRFLKNIVEPPSSPSSSNEISYETEFSDNYFEPHNIEKLGNPPPHNNPPDNDPPHDNPLYGNRSLQDYLHHPRATIPSCIMFPPNVQHQEFKLDMIQLLPTFHVLERENPYVHIREFEEVVATFQGKPDSINIVKLRFFSFSLKDSAKVWLYSLRPRSIGSWMR